MRPKHSGFAPILVALGLVVLLGPMSAVMQLAQMQQQKRHFNAMNRRLAFYLGEMGAWHSYERSKAGFTVSSTATPMLMDADYVDGVTMTPDTYSSVAGTPLNLATTRDYVPATTIARRYDPANTTYRQPASSTQCSSARFQGKSYQVCLVTQAAPSGGALIIDSGHAWLGGSTIVNVSWKDSGGLWQAENAVFGNGGAPFHAPVALDSNGIGYVVWAADSTLSPPCSNKIRVARRLGMTDWKGDDSAPECLDITPGATLVANTVDIVVGVNDYVHIVYAETRAPGQFTLMYRRGKGSTWDPAEYIDTRPDPPDLNVSIALSKMGTNPVRVVTGQGTGSGTRYFYYRDTSTIPNPTWGPGPNIDGGRAQVAASMACDTMTSGKTSEIINPFNSFYFFSSCYVSATGITTRYIHKNDANPWTVQPIGASPGNVPFDVDGLESTYEFSGGLSAVYPSDDHLNVIYGHLLAGVWTIETITPPPTGLGNYSNCKHIEVSGKGVLVTCDRGPGFPSQVVEYFRTAPNVWVESVLPAAAGPGGPILPIPPNASGEPLHRAIRRLPADWAP
ncbi:MAG: hypothetical protein HYR96_12395 [Deltaproteobacteria bacterium]|nr:hypothetical protein [Deltaproteobacteria bacterium]MBI3296002.1 hypothetical protein [Deltaproteobacteria bacterium]